MSWKGQLAKNLQELRILICQTSKASQGARDFITKSYKDLKSANPDFPILVREASGIEAKLVARYDKGVEKAVSIDGLSVTEISKQLQGLVKQA